jgi:hypothetical protein
VPTEYIVNTCQTKIIVQGVPPKTQQLKSQYNLLEKLGKIATQISILELLRICPNHRASLDKALRDTSIPTDLDVNHLQEMVVYLANSHHVTFSQQDYSSHKSTHNDPLHLEFLVHKNKIR